MGYALRHPDEKSHAATREQLLEAAGEVFAETGFRAATVRQICERARANVAAVNYHFGDKEKLYLEVLRASAKTVMNLDSLRPDSPAKAKPPERLRAFIHALLRRIFSEGAPARHGKLMAREMIEPTFALDEIIRHDIRPMSEELNGIVAALLGTRAGEPAVRLGAMSVVSQVLFYHHCRASVSRLYPRMKFNGAAVEELTRHITLFSLAGIRELKKKPLP